MNADMIYDCLTVGFLNNIFKHISESCALLCCCLNPYFVY